MSKILIQVAEMRQIAADIRRLQSRLIGVGLHSVSVLLGGCAQRVEVKIEEALR